MTRVKKPLRECGQEERGLEGLEVQGSDVEGLLQKVYDEDSLVKDIMRAVETGQRRHARIPLADCEIQGDRLYHQGRLYIPQNDRLRLRLIQEHHDNLAAGHPELPKR